MCSYPRTSLNFLLLRISKQENPLVASPRVMMSFLCLRESFCKCCYCVVHGLHSTVMRCMDYTAQIWGVSQKSNSAASIAFPLSVDREQDTELGASHTRHSFYGESFSADKQMRVLFLPSKSWDYRKAAVPTWNLPACLGCKLWPHRHA